MSNMKCMMADCAHCMGSLGCEYPELDRWNIDPTNCPEYISSEEYEEESDE